MIGPIFESVREAKNELSSMTRRQLQSWFHVNHPLAAYSGRGASWSSFYRALWEVGIKYHEKPLGDKEHIHSR